MRPFLGQNPDDLERDASDRDLLPDHRRGCDVQHRGDGRAQDGDAPAGGVVPGGEHAAGGDGVVLHRHEARRRAQHVHVDVSVALLDLKARPQLGHDVGHVVGAVRERGVVVHREADAVVACHPMMEALAGIHGQQRRTEGLQALPDRLLRPRAQREHRDDRADADDDAQHGEQRAQLVRAQRLEGDLDDLAEQHRLPPRCTRPAPNAGAAAAAGMHCFTLTVLADANFGRGAGCPRLAPTGAPHGLSGGREDASCRQSSPLCDAESPQRPGPSRSSPGHVDAKPA